MGSQDRRKGQSSTPPQEAAPHAQQQDVMKVLTEFESGLDALRKLYAERQALQERLREREGELAARDEQLTSKTNELTDLRSRFDEQVAELDRTRSDIEQRERELADRADQLDHAMRAHAEAQRQSEEATAAALQEIEAQRTTLRRDTDKLHDRTKDLEKRTKELSEQLRTLEQSQRQVAQERQQLTQERSQLDELRSVLETRSGELASREKRLDELKQRVSELEQLDKQAQKQIATREKRISELQDSLGERERALEIAQRELDANAKSLEAAQQRSRAQDEQVQQTQRELTQLREQLNAAHGQTREAQAQGEAQKAALSAQLAKEQQAAQQLREEAGRQATQFEHLSEQNKQQEQQLANLWQQLANEQAMASESAAQWKHELEQARERIARAESGAADIQRAMESAMTEKLTQAKDRLTAEFAREREAQRVAFAEDKRNAERKASERISQAIAEATSASNAALERRLREEMEDEVRHEREFGEQKLAAERARWEADAQARLQEAIRDARSTGSGETEKALIARHESERQRMMADFDRQLADLRTQHHQQQQALQQAHQQVLAQREHEARAARDEAMQRAVQEAQAQALAEAEAQAQAMLAAAVATAREQTREQTRRDVQAELQTIYNAEREQLEALAKARIDAALQDAQSLASQSSSQRDAAALTWRKELEDEREQRSKLVRALTDVVDEYEQLWTVERGEAARLSGEVQRLHGDASSADDVVSALRSRLKQEHDAHREAKEQLETTSHQLADAISRVVALESRLRTHSEDGGHVAGTWRTPESMARQRQRLALARTLTRAHTEKVRRGSEALRRRFEQTEKVIAQRQELAQARERIIEAEKRVQSSAGKSRAAVVLLCIVTSIGILGGLSYGLARELAPATFIATSVIAADGRGRDLNTRELAEWRTYHEKILSDARFHQMAAERFQRVGIEGLNVPSAVKQLCEQGIDAQEPSPGLMQLALAGKGSTRTERILDTLTAALVSHANSAQTARVDGSVTTVKQQAKAGSDPIDQTRLYYALAMAGAGLVFCGMIALGVWRKLAGAKTQFERDTQLAAVLDQAKWGDVEMPDAAETTARTVKQEKQERTAKREMKKAA